MPVDPSSACQRLFNAAIHDLKEKLVLVGLDVCKSAAQNHKLPIPNSDEDIYDNYPTSKVIDLSYRVGLLDRPDWRRLKRAYSIRKDLEHEDDEYEADAADCVYIFKACIEIVLERDFIEILRVDDVVSLVGSSESAQPSADMAEDFEHAPDVRQEEICRMLISKALNTEEPDIVQQNSVEALRTFRPCLKDPVRARLTNAFITASNRTPYTLRQMIVAHASGVTEYLRVKKREAFFDSFITRLETISYHWTAFEQHGSILDELEDIGGLAVCPSSKADKLFTWLVRCYIGEQGGRTRYGNIRHVFYSNAASPKIEQLFTDFPDGLRANYNKVIDNGQIMRLCRDIHIQRRLDTLTDYVEGITEPDSSD